MKNLIHIFSFCLLVSFGLGLQAQTFSDQSQIPVDKNVLIGKLDNGLTYYIKKNSKPEDKVFLRLAVNAGSILEDDDQQGLAHFVEHMGFNGTKHFEKNELVNYLQSIGVEFGADLNAYTSFDETVYMLPVPSTRPGLVDTGLMVLEDWAFNMLFEDEEIDKERGVILEELRLGQGAQQRMRDKYFPEIFKGSMYAKRLPIGKKDLLETFPYKNIKRFYKDWYRPNLMAIIAVGDLEPQEMKKKIERHFGSYQNPKMIKERIIFDVPDNEGTIISIAQDKEAPYSVMQLFYKDDVTEMKTWSDYRKSLSVNLMTGMMNKRLEELKQQATPPFFVASTYYGGFVRAKNAFGSFVVHGPAGEEQALKALLKEIKRVKKYGFSESELERYKLDYMKGMEKALAEKDKTESGNYVSEYVNHFLEKEPIPGIDLEYQYTASVMDKISISEINELAKQLIKENNRVVVLTGPENPAMPAPTKDDVSKWLQEVDGQMLTPYQDKLANAKLLEDIPVNNGNVMEAKDIQLDISKLTLSNGVKVVLKPTGFKNDEILMKAYSLGGESLVPDEEFLSSEFSSDLISQSGVNEYSKTDLQKLLAGKDVSVQPFISSYTEGVTGSCSPSDLESMLQLTYLYFTKPNYDEESFQSLINKQKMILPNLLSDPRIYFSDQVQRILNQNHPRGSYIMSLEDLDEVSLDDAYNNYLSRFADADDFVFYFVGNFDVESMKPLLNKYLGSLPILPTSEKIKDLGIRPPAGNIEKVIRKGQDDKSIVQMFYLGAADYSLKEKFLLDVLSEVLNIKLIENLREEMSGVYGVGSRASITKYPYQNYRFAIYIPCGPENAEKLTQAAIDEVEKIKENGPTEEDLKKVKETFHIQHKEKLKDNSYWLNTLFYYDYYGIQPIKILDEEELMQSITAKDIQVIANKYLNTKDLIKIVLMPE